MAAGRTDDRKAVAEDVTDVPVAGWVQLDYGAVGVGPAVSAHIGNADLAVEACTEVGAAGCRALVGMVVESVVGVLGITRPCD